MATLLTGGFGVIGAEVTRLLLERGGQRPALLDVNPSHHRLGDIAEQVDVIRGDVGTFSNVLDAVKRTRPTAIYHLGGMFSLPWPLDVPVHPNVDVDVAERRAARDVPGLGFPLEGIIGPGAGRALGLTGKSCEAREHLGRRRIHDSFTVLEVEEHAHFGIGDPLQGPAGLDLLAPQPRGFGHDHHAERWGMMGEGGEERRQPRPSRRGGGRRPRRAQECQRPAP
jgi:hypothetical protein